MDQKVESMTTGTELYRKMRSSGRKPVDPFRLESKGLLLCGHPGAGKSTFVLSIPRCCVICTEGGACEIASYLGIPSEDPRFPHRVQSSEDLERVLAFLVEDSKHNGDRRTYDMVAIDTVDTLGGSGFSILARKVAADNGTDYISTIGKGVGWVRLTELMNDVLLKVEGAGYGTVLVTHLIRKRESDAQGNEATRLTRDLTPRIDTICRNRTQFVGVIEKKIERRPKKAKVKLPDGTVKETEVGEESTIVHRLVFRSTDPATEEWLKARLLDDPVFEFSETDGWAQLKKRFESALTKRRTINKETH